LSQFDLYLIYKPGKTMTLSDPLSRRADTEDVKEEEAVVVLPDSLFVNLLDTELTRILKETLPDGQANQEDSDWEVQEINGQPRVFYQGRTYVPDAPTLRKRILQEYHDHPTAGHPGTATTLINLKRDYWWPGMPNFVREYVKGCLLCQRNKINRNPWKGPLFLIKEPLDPLPFKQISMDLMTDLPPTDDGYDTLLVVVDHGLSKGVILVPTTKTVKSTGIAELLQDNVFRRYGIPDTLISDRDPRFASMVFQEWLKILGIKSNMTTAYHPQSNGATE
jgi:hypothetical protein